MLLSDIILLISIRYRLLWKFIIIIINIVHKFKHASQRWWRTSVRARAGTLFWLATIFDSALTSLFLCRLWLPHFPHAPFRMRALQNNRRKFNHPAALVSKNIFDATNSPSNAEYSESDKRPTIGVYHVYHYPFFDRLRTLYCTYVPRS